MQISKLSIYVFLAAMGGLQVAAQPASPEAQAKALELLQQTIAQQREYPTQVTYPATAPASADQHEKALQALRKNIEDQQRGAYSGSPKQPAPPVPVKPVNPANVSTNRAATAPAPAAPESPHPPTKQERLMKLLDDYKADKLTPAQYHAERAKILSEP